jgi:REP element-mobilizing transposase RayT/O-antigen ligase
MPVKSSNLLNQLKNTNRMLWGTLGYLFLFIFRPFEYWTWLGDYHIERVYMICLLIALLLWRGKRYVHHSITIAFIAFFLVICFSIIIAYRPSAAIREAEEYFKLMVLFFVIILTVKDEKDFRLLIFGFIVIMGFYVGKSLWEFLLHGRHVYRMGIRRLIGIDQTYSDPNTFAASVVYSLPFAWALWKSDASKWIRKSMIAYGLMSFVAIIFTGSRSGMVTLILFMFLIWAKKKQKFLGRILGLVGLVIVLLSSWQFIPAEYKLRYLTIVDDSINKSATVSAEGRTEGLKNGLRLLAKSPLFGWGAGNFPYAVERLGIFNRMQSHNLYGQLLGDLGFLGLVAFSAICWLLYGTNSRIQKVARQSGQKIEAFFLIPAVSNACLNTMILLLFQGNFGHNLYRYTWLLIGAILVLGQNLMIKQMVEEYRMRFRAYHIMFVTKFRKPILVGGVAPRLCEWVREICASKAAAVLRFRLSRDCIDMLVVLPKRMSVSELAKFIRVETSQKIFSEFKKLKDEFPAQDLWERSSVAQVRNDVATKYLMQKR